MNEYINLGKFIRKEKKIRFTTRFGKTLFHCMHIISTLDL